MTVCVMSGFAKQSAEVANPFKKGTGNPTPFGFLTSSDGSQNAPAPMFGTGSLSAFTGPPNVNLASGTTAMTPLTTPSNPFGGGTAHSSMQSSTNPFASANATSQHSGEIRFGTSTNLAHNSTHVMNAPIFGTASLASTPANERSNTLSTSNFATPHRDLPEDMGFLNNASRESNASGSNSSPFHAPFTLTASNGGDVNADPSINRLAMLKARKAELEAKKMRLQDIKRRKQEAKSGTQTPLQRESRREVENLNTKTMHRETELSSRVTANADLESLHSISGRNVARFSGTTNEQIRALLPADLKEKTETEVFDNSALRVDTRDDPQNFENAKSLLGTCQYLCPDEELLRRERESDIQMLEIPMPGVLHPPNWTLRDTVVKRFRRSAADYKLDVPEWVRPPDILEKACAYLEEWVMVSST
jgi:nuclear mRNA export protein SAC3